eukprot:scaffold448560_cov29-Prasinocladus_malaysianus.AAC.1
MLSKPLSQQQHRTSDLHLTKDKFRQSTVKYKTHHNVSVLEASTVLLGGCTGEIRQFKSEIGNRPFKRLP